MDELRDPVSELVHRVSSTCATRATTSPRVLVVEPGDVPRERLNRPQRRNPAEAGFRSYRD